MTIMLVSETLDKTGNPLSDTCEWFLKKSLSQLGVEYKTCYLTSVIKEPRDVYPLCGPRKTAVPHMPALVKGKYLQAEYGHHLQSFYAEVNRVQPTVILAMGPTAVWALCGTSGVMGVRGAVTTAVQSPGLDPRYIFTRPFKVVPTYHPSAVQRDYTLRPIFWSDVDKARRYSTTKDITRPSRLITVSPTLDEIREFEERHMRGADLVAVDIETARNQVTCVGFAPNDKHAIVIPFMLDDGSSYWKTAEEELEAWGYVARWCGTYPTLFQNGMYDMNWLWTKYGIPCDYAAHDTMLLHHALQPEMQKGLGFLSSLYTDEMAWKSMYKSARDK